MNSKLQVRSSLLVLIGALLALSGCPKVPDADALVAAPRIISFTGSAATVPVGGKVTLSWKTENATAIKIEELKVGAVSGVENFEGSLEVGISGDSYFVLTVRNARGAADSAIVVVRTGASDEELLITALPTTVQAGQATTIAWVAPGATAVTLVAAPGGPVDVGTQTATGVVTVSPTATTVYTLTAGGRSVNTTVAVAPTLLSFTSSTLAADAGGTVTLSWATANATRVQLSAPGRGTLADVTDAAAVAAGTFDDTLPAVVDPGQVFAYELTVTGPGAMITRSLVVGIDGHPAIPTFTAPRYARAGADAGVRLVWTTIQADGFTLSTGGNEFYRAQPGAVASGSVTLPTATSDITYTAKATNSRGGFATASATIDVVGAPSVTLTATPTTPMVGEAITLAWSGTDVRNVVITDSNGAVVFRGTDVTDTGSVPTPVRVAVATTYRIIADNGVGETASSSATVTPSGSLVITRSPAGSLRQGQTMTLNWPSTTTLYGLPHKTVTVNTASTGFDDISTTGTAISFSGTTSQVTEINPMNFTAPFFGRLVGSRVWVTTTGYLSFLPANSSNSTEAALPSAKLESMSIAGCWDGNTLGTPGVRWQVKPEATGQVLIVQWKDLKNASTAVVTFQIKVHSTGQVDLEYQTWSGTSGVAGVQGRRANEGFDVTASRGNAVGITFFAPITTGTADFIATSELPIVGFVEASGQYLPVPFDVGTVVTARDLSLSETMVTPSVTVGATGQWFEFFNTRDTAIDLTDWSFGLADGGSTAALSGTIAPRGTLVVGATVDGTLNDDAGVQVALTGFTTSGSDAGTLVFGRSGTLASFSWADPSPGVAQVSDFGPYRLSTDSSSAPSHPVTCAATASFGSKGQLGTPGTDGTCGFGYTYTEIRPGFFDISGIGTPGITGTSFDSVTFDIDLSSAPFPFFGANRSTARPTTNGFVAFGASASGTDSMSSAIPSTTDTNLLIAAFGDDLDKNSSLATQIYWMRVGANVDPAAAAPHWIIQWSHFSHWLCADDLNFQVKLFDDGKAEIHFAEMRSGSCSTQYGSGVSSNTWVENAAGTQALVINATSLTPGISPNSAFRISPR